MELVCSDNKTFLIFQKRETLKSLLYSRKTEKFLSFLKRKLFLYFRKRKPPKNLLYVLERKLFL